MEIIQLKKDVLGLLACKNECWAYLSKGTNSNLGHAGKEVIYSLLKVGGTCSFHVVNTMDKGTKSDLGR